MVHVLFSRVRFFWRLSAFLMVSAFALIPGFFLYAAAPPQEGGTLTVITVPERAEVWIDGGYAGLTPIRDKVLAPGRYTLRLVDPTRQTSTSETVVIGDGERLIVERSLGGSYARLRVDTDPQGANVGISADLGKTPIVNDYLTPGQYKIEIRHPNTKYLPIFVDTSFVDGQLLTISHKLGKPPLFTTKRTVQLALGTGAALAWTWAVIEQHVTSSSLQKSIYATDDGRAEKMSTRAENAGIRRTVAVSAAGVLTVALQVTIFIW